MLKEIIILVLSSLFLLYGYDKNSAKEWAETCAYGCDECPDDNTCGCTYFTTHALKHGSWGYGLEGVCANLWSNFKQNKYSGWIKSGSSESIVGPGSKNHIKVY